MKKINYFNNRKECKDFLSQFNFKYFVPYVREGELKEENKRYYVELNNDLTKVRLCSVEFLSGEFSKSVYNQHCFYDSDNAYIKVQDGNISARYDLEEKGENRVKELKEKDINYYV